jgi:hypothetical protein
MFEITLELHCNLPVCQAALNGRPDVPRRRFTNTLALMVWISVAWIAFEMYFKVRKAPVLGLWVFPWTLGSRFFV